MSDPAITVSKSLDAKVNRLVADPGCRDFILADAKDADMAFGLAAPGLAAGGDRLHGPFRTLDEFRGHIREIVAQGLRADGARHFAGPGIAAVSPQAKA